jgi:hypothetical protein
LEVSHSGQRNPNSMEFNYVAYLTMIIPLSSFVDKDENNDLILVKNVLIILLLESGQSLSFGKRFCLSKAKECNTTWLSNLMEYWSVLGTSISLHQAVSFKFNLDNRMPLFFSIKGC